MDFILDHEEVPHSPEDFPRLECQLANGHNVAFECLQYYLVSGISRFWDPFAVPIFAIRVYGDEDFGPKRLRLLHELRMGPDFRNGALGPAWAWLSETTASRDAFDYDSAEDLVSALAAELDRNASEEATRHYDFLPDMSQPELFDEWDDSVNNDQEGTES